MLLDGRGGGERGGRWRRENRRKEDGRVEERKKEERRERQNLRGGETKKIRREAIQLIRKSGENEMVVWWRGESERGVKGQQVFLFICCSISVIDLVFSHQPPGLSRTHTHATHTHRAS